MVQFQRNSVYRYDSKTSETEKNETEWMEKEKMKTGDGGRKSSLKSTPPRSQSSLHVHFPPESTLISVTMIPPPPEKMTALRSLKKVLFCCCSGGGDGAVEGGEEDNTAAATS